MGKHCENCGCKQYDGFCTNCHEEIYIEQQYEDLEMECPDSILEITAKQREEVYRKNKE